LVAEGRGPREMRVDRRFTSPLRPPPSGALSRSPRPKPPRPTTPAVDHQHRGRHRDLGGHQHTISTPRKARPRRRVRGRNERSVTTVLACTIAMTSYATRSPS
jgi:hypothetical protein